MVFGISLFRGIILLYHLLKAASRTWGRGIGFAYTIGAFWGISRWV
jgi:hypothetical protein